MNTVPLVAFDTCVELGHGKAGLEAYNANLAYVRDPNSKVIIHGATFLRGEIKPIVEGTTFRMILKETGRVLFEGTYQFHFEAGQMEHFYKDGRLRNFN